MRLSRMIFRRLLPQEQKARVDPSMRNGMPLLRAVLIQLQKIRALIFSEIENYFSTLFPNNYLLFRPRIRDSTGIICDSL